MPRSETESAIDKQIGSAVRRARMARGLSQQQLAATMQISYQQLHKYERGLNHLSVARLIEIARALDSSPADLLADIGAAPPDPSRGRPILELMRAAAGLPDDIALHLAALARRFGQPAQEAA